MGSMEVFEGSDRLNITATNTALKSGNLIGILVASSTSGTLKVADVNGTICNTMNVTEGSFYRMPTRFMGGLTVTVGGTLNATIFYKI